MYQYTQYSDDILGELLSVYLLLFNVDSAEIKII